MDANTMADELELLMDRSYSYGSPGYEDYELESVLNLSYWHYIKTYYDELNNQKKHGFEETELRGRGLGELIRATTLTPSTNQTGVIKNGVYYDLPQDFLVAIYEEVELNKLDCNNDNISGEVRRIAHNEINRLRTNKYKRPKSLTTEAWVWRLHFSRQIDTYTSIVLSLIHI